MKWLLRLLFIRMLGRRALAILALLGLVGAIRNARARDATGMDRAPDTVRVRDEHG